MVGKELLDSVSVEEFRGCHSGESMFIFVALQAEGHEIQDVGISFTHRTKVSILSQLLGWDPQKTGHFSAKDFRDRVKRATERADSSDDGQKEKVIS
jgi:hypothetical protein